MLLEVGKKGRGCDFCFRKMLLVFELRKDDRVVFLEVGRLVGVYCLGVGES